MAHLDLYDLFRTLDGIILDLFPDDLWKIKVERFLTSNPSEDENLATYLVMNMRSGDFIEYDFLFCSDCGQILIAVGSDETGLGGVACDGILAKLGEQGYQVDLTDRHGLDGGGSHRCRQFARIPTLKILKAEGTGF